ncbi:unnamed protein product [Schistosoma mattheei]|uniref:Uncharacterized protein n=1 Tax=Schistosoma mattheei TaxID=31246 RepID=A0A183PVZ6_9TREM|nr:unnamed protein product [Schistosoma mattheei]
MVDAAKKCFGKHSRNASNSSRSVDTQINVKETKVSPVIDDSRPSKKEKQSPKRLALNKSSRKVGSSVLRLPDGIQQETPRSRNRKDRSVSSGKHNPTSQVVENPPKSNTRFNATVIASTSTVDEWVKVVRKKSWDIKEKPAPNGHKLKDSGVLIRKDLPLADRVKRREAEKELQLRLDAGEEDLKIVNFRVVRLRQRMMPKPL